MRTSADFAMHMWIEHGEIYNTCLESTRVNKNEVKPKHVWLRDDKRKHECKEVFAIPYLGVLV